MSYVRVTVHEGKDLLAADITGTSDPYCVLQIGDTRVKTTIIYKTLNPVWNEGFDLNILHTSKLTISCWDKDLVTDDYLGHVVIDLATLSLDGSSVWMPLLPRPGKKEKVKGEIRLSCVPGNAPQVAPTPIKKEKSVSSKDKDQVDASSQIRNRVIAAINEKRSDVDLSGCSLTVIPSIILEGASNWTSIDFGFNSFNAWPDFTGLENIQELFFAGNQLTSLTHTIANLKFLRILFLNGNNITDLPDEIGDLENLEVLDLSNNGLKMLPMTIGQLSKLEELKLSGNPFTHGLPPEIGDLKFLGTLDLNGCQLHKLPDELCQLERLIDLDLGNNQLPDLPREFGDMTRLVRLNLSDNKLVDLPMSMGKCLQLDSCQMERNKFNDEEMMRKYNVGTDHLVDFLEKRMFQYDQQKKKKKQGKKRPGMPRDGAPSLSEFTEGKQPESLSGLSMEDVARQREEATWAKLTPGERLNKKKFRSQQDAYQAKQDLIDIKRNLMKSDTVEAMIPHAKVVRDLKTVLEGAKGFLPSNIQIPKPPPLFPNETKFQQLKKVTLVALKEVEVVLTACINSLSSQIPEEIVEGLREVVEMARMRLAEVVTKDKPKEIHVEFQSHKTEYDDLVWETPMNNSSSSGSTWASPGDIQ